MNTHLQLLCEVWYCAHVSQCVCTVFSYVHVILDWLLYLVNINYILNTSYSESAVLVPEFAKKKILLAAVRKCRSHF